MDLPAVKLLLVVVDPVVRICRQAIDLRHLEGFGNLCADIERIRIIVGVGALQQPKVEPALEEAGAVSTKAGYRIPSRRVN